MLIEKVNFSSDPSVFLSAYILDSSREMPNMEQRPGVLVIPGGGYFMCSDREAEPVAMAFAAQGYNTFVLRYSVGRDKSFELALRDAKAALSAIYERAREWHVDSGRVAAIGFSAGGHLAAALCVTDGVRPAACILGYPCILEDMGDKLAFGVVSLDKSVDEKTPPTFIFASSRDSSVPIINSLEYARALALHGVDFELHVFERGRHGFSLGTSHVCADPDSVKENLRASQWVKLCDEWLKDRFSL